MGGGGALLLAIAPLKCRVSWTEKGRSGKRGVDGGVSMRGGGGGHYVFAC